MAPVPGSAPHVFDQDTAVEVVSRRETDGAEVVTLRVVLSRRWWIARGPNGGYVAAVMQRAFQVVAGDRPPRSMTVHFADAPEDGEVEIEIRVVREGRTITFLAGLMRQGGASMLSAVAIFGEARESRLEYEGADAVMPAEAGEPGEMMSVPPGTPGVPAVFENFMARIALGPTPFSGGKGKAADSGGADVGGASIQPDSEDDAGDADGGARTGAWLRLVEPRQMDAALATAVLDVWIPAPFVKLDSPAPAPTLDLTYHYRAPLPLAEASPEDAYLLEARSSLARGGYFEEDARLWHPSGVLIAHARQLALL